LFSPALRMDRPEIHHPIGLTPVTDPPLGIPRSAFPCCLSRRSHDEGGASGLLETRNASRMPTRERSAPTSARSCRPLAPALRPTPCATLVPMPSPPGNFCIASPRPPVPWQPARPIHTDVPTPLPAPPRLPHDFPPAPSPPNSRF
jgi:hypothetical protein